MDGRGGGPASSAGVIGKGADALLLRASVLRSSVFAMAGSGKGKDSSTCKLSSNKTSRSVTDFKTKPGATLAPTRKGRGACLSTEINAAPWPDALASTPITRKRSAGANAEPANVGRGAPNTRASSAGVPATTATVAGTASTAGLTATDRPACTQYHAHSNAVPINRPVIKRRLASVSKFIMTHTSSTHAYRPCKRDRGWLARGFTLIELMVVLVIIGVLAALIVPNVLDRADDARVAAARVDVNNLMQALKLYRLDNQRYPTADQGLRALVQRPDKSPVPTNWKAYVDKLPNDPWGQPYVYLNPGVQGEIDVMSYGADGQPGGEGKNADIGSWQ
jgi:general secretion pathway protein G